MYFGFPIKCEVSKGLKEHNIFNTVKAKGRGVNVTMRLEDMWGTNLASHF
jgi:hypothetical protein